MNLLLDTSSAVIDALGGTKATAELCQRAVSERVSMQRVSNWRKTNIPAEFFLVVSEELDRKDLRAAPCAFGMLPAPALAR